MKSAWRMFFALLATASIATFAWSQGGQGGGGGAGSSSSAGAGASGSAGARAANTAAAGAAGTAGTAGTAGSAGNAGTAGTADTAGDAGTAGAAGIGGTPGVNGAGTGGMRGGVGATGGAGRTDSNQPGTNGSAFNAFNNGISQTPFFTDPGTRQQLNLNDNQFNTLNRAYQDAYGAYSRGINNLNNSLTPQQRQQKLEMLGNQFRNTYNRSLDSTFTDPAMRARYDQLYRQSLGFNAFNQPAIQSQLNLTPQQQHQIRQLAQTWRQQLQRYQANGNYNIPPNQWSTMYNQYWNQLNGILTPQQQQTWQQLTGQRYPFSPNMYFGQGGNATGNVVPSGNAGGVPGSTAGTSGTNGGGTSPSGRTAAPPGGGTSTATGTSSQGTTTR